MSIPLFVHQPVGAADADRGEALYVGAVSPVKGGAPCLACHPHAGSGMGQTEGYGPDLSSRYDDYGPEETEAVLQDLSFPSMAAIYVTRPLTEQEVADLGTFFEQTASSTAPSSDRLFLWVSVILVVLILLLVLGSRRNMPGIRQALIDDQRKSAQKGGLS